MIAWRSLLDCACRAALANSSGALPVRSMSERAELDPEFDSESEEFDDFESVDDLENSRNTIVLSPPGISRLPSACLIAASVPVVVDG